MFFQALKTPGIAHVAYVLGSNGDALVVDPRRDVDVYLEVLQARGLRLRYVLQTHRQEDFIQGTAELSRRTGAPVVAGKHPISGYADLQLGGHERFHLGGLTLMALHTPGHTLESTSFAVFLDPHHSEAWGVFTGDALFAGETGRTDLADPARTRENAGHLYDSLHRELLPLGDQALVLPAHGTGSVCGGHIADRDLTTLGIERRENPVFRLGRVDFIQHKQGERLPRPPHFARMEVLNLTGGHPLARAPCDVPMLSPRDFAESSRGGLVLDAREPEAFAGGHIPGALSLWPGGLPIFGGWVVRQDVPVHLVLPEGADAAQAVLSLARIGIDRVEGVLSGGFGAWRNSGLPVGSAGTLTPVELHEHAPSYQVLDVREPGEFEEGHIRDARHVYVGELEERLPEMELRPEEPVAVTCATGRRSGLAASILLRHGFQRVSNLLGGMTAWKSLDLPVEPGPGQPGLLTPGAEEARTAVPPPY